MNGVVQRLRTDWGLGLVICAFMGVALSFSKIFLVHFFLVVAPVFIFYSLRESGDIRKFIVSVWGALFWVIYFYLAIAWSENKVSALKFAVLISTGVLTLISVATIRGSIRKILLILFWLVTASLILGILEGVTPLRYPISKYSSYVGYFRKSVTNEDQSAPYPTSFFWSPNNLCLVILLSVPFLPLLKRKWIELTFILLAILLNVLCSSRGILVLLGLYMLYRTGSILQKGGFFRRSTLIIGGVAILCLTGIFLSLSGDNLKSVHSMDQVIKGQTGVYRAILNGERYVYEFRSRREELLQETVDLWKKHPFLGAGGGQFYGKTIPFRGLILDLSSPHHYWMELAAYGGLFFIVPLFLWFFSLLRKLGKQKSELSGCAFVSFVLFLAGAPACSSLVYFFPTWLFLGLIVLISEEGKSEV